MRAPLAALAFVAVALAGCTGGGEPPPSDPTPTPDAPIEPTPPPAGGTPIVVPTGFNATGCDQLHAIFPAPQAAFDLPAGFTLADGLVPGTATLVVYPMACVSFQWGNASVGDDGFPLGDMWVGPIVDPPPELADGDAQHIFVTDLITDNEVWGNALFDHGAAYAKSGSVEHQGSVQPGDGSHGQWIIGAGDDLHILPYVAPNGDGTFPTGTTRYWIWDGTEITGHVDAIRLNEGLDRGLGSVVWTEQGPEAPDGAVGIAHRVDSVDVEYRWVAAEP